jgi:hypothetical protein
MAESERNAQVPVLWHAFSAAGHAVFSYPLQTEVFLSLIKNILGS